MSDNATSARREAFWIIVIWAIFAVWVLGYAARHAFADDPGQVTLTLGFPSWVVWGVALPWMAATMTTVVFCLVVMKDEAD